MNLPFFGIRDLILLVGALLGFVAAFLIPPRGGGKKNPVVPALGVGIILTGGVFLITGFLSGFDLRVWGNTIGLIVLGGVVLVEYRRSLHQPSPVVARVKVGGAEHPEQGPAATSTQQPSESKHPGVMKVACPSCGTVIEVPEGSSWIKCPKCGLEGKIGG
ncbi:MAG: hypothetical protein J7L88_01450 [Thermoplasmata archaeon]|nr:hypothetical protein [Thermoplasmata archaeon]